MSKKITKAKAADALVLVIDFLRQELGGVAEVIDKAADKVNTDDDLGGELDDLDDLGDGLGMDEGEPDPRYAELKKLLTTISKKKKNTKMAYAILMKVECKDIDSVDLDDLDKVIKIAKAQLKKLKK